MRISPYSPHAFALSKPAARTHKVVAGTPQFKGSAGPNISDFTIPLIFGGIAGIGVLGMLLACIGFRSGNRSSQRANYDPSDWAYNPRHDTFSLTNREPVIVHNAWNDSSNTITPGHTNVVLEEIRRPEPAVIRDESNEHAERVV